MKLGLQFTNSFDEREFVIDPGCFGHVCPPWFAPPIPCDKRLKHQSNGNRRRGATTRQTDNCLWTHDGEQWQTSFFFQITFDVMSVRRPLLSTFALKRQRITIVFNHDYDRIIFWNETVCRIFVIRTCMSDLLMGYHLAKRW